MCHKWYANIHEMPIKYKHSSKYVTYKKHVNTNDYKEIQPSTNTLTLNF
jgi:hypothetical protein